MSEINNKYKVWDKDKENWVTDYEDVYLNEDGEVWIIKEESWAYQTYMSKENITDDVKVVHSVGQLDKYNNELYEGDVCLFTPFLVETQPTFKGVIEWDKYRYAIRNLDYKTSNPLTMYATPYVNLDLFGISVEKLGSSYERPDLLHVILEI